MTALVIAVHALVTLAVTVQNFRALDLSALPTQLQSRGFRTLIALDKGLHWPLALLAWAITPLMYRLSRNGGEHRA